MKKVSVLYVLLLTACGFVPGLFIFNAGLNSTQTIFLYVLFSGIFTALLFRFGGNIVLNKRFDALQDKMKEKGYLLENSFRSLLVMVWVNREEKRIAVLPRLNPWKPQEFAGGSVQEVSVINAEDVYGNTKEVSLLVQINNEMLNIPTFVSARKGFPVQSPYVQTALKNAERYKKLLLQIKE